MGLFCGKKCKCKQMCRGAFPFDATIEDGCINACRSNPRPASSDDYIKNYLTPELALQYYAIDLPGDDVDICSLPGNEFEPACMGIIESEPDYTFWYIAAGILIVGLIYFYLK